MVVVSAKSWDVLTNKWMVARGDKQQKKSVDVLTYLWYTYKYILLASFDKSNCCSNPWFYFIVLWAYCSFHYYWIIPSNNPTPLIQYFTRQIIHPYYNTCICQLLWILIIELFLFICIVTSACAYLYTHRGIEIVMQSAGVQHMIQITLPHFHWWSYLCFQPCPIIDIAVQW